MFKVNKFKIETFVSKVNPKSQDLINRISQKLETNFLFKDLD